MRQCFQTASVFENYLYIEWYFNRISYAYDIKYHIYIKRFSIPHHILTLHLQIEWKTVSLFVYRIIFNFEHVNHSFHWLSNDFGVPIQMHWHSWWLPLICQFIISRFTFCDIDTCKINENKYEWFGRIQYCV